MMQKKIQTGFVILALTAAAIFAVAPAGAVDFAISGQINRAALYADDGKTAKWFFVDNDNSSTRFRFMGSNDFTHDLSVGILWEVEMQSNPSNKMNMKQDTDTTDVHFDERKIEFWVGSPWGKVWMGQGSTASDGTSEVDLSGTTLAAYSSVGDVGGGFVFQKNGTYTGVTVGGSRSNFDGFSRKDRIRYDTPKFAGFYGSGSIGNGSRWDTALRYAGDFGGFKLAAAAAWSDYGQTSSTEDNIFSSSASILFDFGLNFTASYAYQKQDNTDPYNIFGKVGYKFLEKHAVSVQYSRTENLSAKDDKGDTFGLGYVFSPWKSVEFYGTYYLYMLDRNNSSDPDDINVGMIGGRVKF
jgi:hypothetical protein